MGKVQYNGGHIAFTYDFDRDGGAIGQILLTPSDIVPIRGVITDFVVEVEAAVTGDPLVTSLSFDTTGAAGSMLAVALIPAFAINTVIVGPAGGGAPVLALVETQFFMTIGMDVVTGGRLVCYAKYDFSGRNM